MTLERTSIMLRPLLSFTLTRLSLLALAVSITASGNALAICNVTLTQDTTVSTSGLTLASNATYGCQINGLSFQQDIVTSYNGYQYVAYYNGDRHVALARRALPAGSWQTIVFSDYYFSGDDAHNTISLGICPNDGTIHLAFDHHGENLNYRVSQQAVAADPAAYSWTADLFSSVTDTLESAPVTVLTYPAFIRTPDGNMQLIYRYGSSGDGIWRIYDYNGSTHSWSGNRTFINATGYYSDSLGSSTSRCAYPNYYCYGPDGRLQVSWCWRESAAGANHDVVYAFSNDGGYKWYNSYVTDLSIGIKKPDGTKVKNLLKLSNAVSDVNLVCNTSDLIMGVTTDSTVVQKIDRIYGMMNTQAHAVDPQGRPHIVMWHCTDQTFADAGYDPATDNQLRWGPATARFYFHYWQDIDGSWHQFKIPGYAGSRPKLFMRANGDAVLIYQACRTVESLNDEIYFTNGDLKIYSASAASRWTDWQEVYQLENNNGYFMNEMLGDVYRFADSGTQMLSVFVQDAPTSSRQSTPVRILDFKLQ